MAETAEKRGEKKRLLKAAPGCAMCGSIPIGFRIAEDAEGAEGASALELAHPHGGGAIGLAESGEILLAGIGQSW